MPYPKPTQLQGITDLTLIATIRPGLIEGIFDSRSYTWRLQRVLELLDAARRASREGDVLPNPFIDGVGRLRGIHFFRFAILPGKNRLLLNVTFDGGWEPYMRLIWGPLGTLLDLIFCHCEGYPLAAASSYENYIRWVRDHEVPSQFFYADSGGSVADRAYLEQLELQQRVSGNRSGADLRAAQLALGPQQPPQPTALAVDGALRSLKGLFSLTLFFGMPSAPSAAVPLDDGSVLLRFAQDYLSDLRNWVAQGLFDPGRQFDALRARFEREREWLMRTRWTRPKKTDSLKRRDQELQVGIMDSPKAPGGRFARGAVVLARVADAAEVRDWLGAATRARAEKPPLIGDGSITVLTDGQVACSVAITYPGLQALHVHEGNLAAFPAEFVQGMEARAGILGDVRGNHPQQWTRPRAWRREAQMAPIDLPMVHLVFQLRTCETVDEAKLVVGDDRSALLDRLEKWVDDLPDTIDVLAVQPGWSRPSVGLELAARDHFNYVDGISQPTFIPSPGNTFWDDEVKIGEVLRGWVNDRGDGPLETPDKKPVPPAWLEMGTFLVVRKIRQYVERFDGIVEKAAKALLDANVEKSLPDARELARKKLMGRGSDGKPLVAQRGPGDNDFDYRHDSDGAQCPFASHVRRTNPRTAMALGRPPRIVRRGMGYGPPADKPRPTGSEPDDRGVLFMAYNASIAEQFEVIQRWAIGGNSSGVPSSQPDPFLGVPRPGEPTLFRFAHGDQVIRIDLGDQPITRLEWGLYAFVPSIDLLQKLDVLLSKADEPPVEERAEAHFAAVGERALKQAVEPEAEAEKWAAKKRVKLEFEDDLSRRARWDQVRNEHAGVEKIGSSVMVGGFSAIKEVLRDPGSTYSAAGYGTRMRDTLGISPFGQDDVGPHNGHERVFVGAVKQAIAASVSEARAYGIAYGFTASRLASQLAGAKAMGLTGAPVDFVELGTDLIAELCGKWFGVVFGTGVAEVGSIDPKAKQVRCPGHFLSMARNIFAADPSPTVAGLAQLQKDALKSAVAQWVKDAATATSAPVLTAVLDAIDKAPSAKGMPVCERVGTVANVMLGMPATLLGSWGKALRLWAAKGDLWKLQHALALPADAWATYAYADAVLRPSLIRTMAADPVADGIWRTATRPHVFHGAQVKQDDVVWLGIGAALADGPGDQQTAEDLLFGGAWQSGTDRDTVHACPGRGLAIGVLLGALAAWLRAGQWASTASPTTLTLKPFP